MAIICSVVGLVNTMDVDIRVVGFHDDGFVYTFIYVRVRQ